MTRRSDRLNAIRRLKRAYRKRTKRLAQKRNLILVDGAADSEAGPQQLRLCIPILPRRKTTRYLERFMEIRPIAFCRGVIVQRCEKISHCSYTRGSLDESDGVAEIISHRVGQQAVQFFQEAGDRALRVERIAAQAGGLFAKPSLIGVFLSLENGLPLVREKRISDTSIVQPLDNRIHQAAEFLADHLLGKNPGTFHQKRDAAKLSGCLWPPDQVYLRFTRQETQIRKRKAFPRRQQIVAGIGIPLRTLWER